ncbi:MAG: hypothetical protein KKF50_03030 [Nanoarchaeota archaeon]|nr:hypothetical protein [Nanoarchaeota archaeon]
MNNKKGISAIVATVLIILITVAAVTIIWAAIIPMIQDQIGGSTECFDASAALSVTTDYSCVNDTSKEAQIQVHRGTGKFTLSDIEIILGAGGNTNSTMVVEDLIQSVPDVNGDRVYTLTYIGDKVTEAGVAAWVEAGNTVKACDKSGMVTIPECA